MLQMVQKHNILKEEIGDTLENMSIDLLPKMRRTNFSLRDKVWLDKSLIRICLVIKERQLRLSYMTRLRNIILKKLPKLFKECQISPQVQ